MAAGARSYRVLLLLLVVGLVSLGAVAQSTGRGAVGAHRSVAVRSQPPPRCTGIVTIVMKPAFGRSPVDRF
jgi:hypothetical protein